MTPADSGYALTGLQPIDLTVGCGERIVLEQCLQVQLAVPPCAVPGPTQLTGTVRSCTNAVTLITYELNGSEPIIVCRNRPEPAFVFDLTLDPGPNALTVTAYNDQAEAAP